MKERHIRVPWLVQVMLKWVVPVYLLAIFAGFCFINLPSHDTLKFTAAGVEAGGLAEGRGPRCPSQSVRQPRPDNSGNGDDAAAATRVPGRCWTAIATCCLSFVRRAPAWRSTAHEMGYVEKIGSSPVAFASLCVRDCDSRFPAADGSHCGSAVGSAGAIRQFCRQGE